MSGLELHDELLRSGLAIPLIFITGHGDVPMAVASMKKGAVDFLEKPFNDEQLCALVRQCLQRAASRQRTVRRGPARQRAPRTADRSANGRCST